MLRVRIAGADYGRTRALADQSVRVEGVEVDYVHMPARESIFEMATREAFDVAEFSISQLMIETSRDLDRFVALPVFPNRAFRHRDIYLGAGSTITHPAQLRGKRVALQRYHVSASVWTRGILASHYGVAPREITWCKADIIARGQPATRVQIDLPDEVTVVRVEHASIDEMLRSGEVDAAILPEAPPAYLDRSSGVERLFGDTAQAEREYYEETGVFPIIHLVVMKRALHDKHPGLLDALHEGFEAARRRWRDHLVADGMQESWTPFTAHRFPRDTAEQIDRFWSYGVEANRVTLETVLGYAWGQGLLARPLELAELFAHAAGTQAAGGPTDAAVTRRPDVARPGGSSRPFDD